MGMLCLQDAAYELVGEQTGWEWIRTVCPDAPEPAARRALKLLGIPTESQVSIRACL